MDYPKIDLSAVDLLALVGADVPLRLKSKNVPGCGPEYCGPAPDGSASHDGFIVWPDHPDGKGLWWNRPQGTSGDAINYLRTYKGMTYTEAIKALASDQAPPPASKANGTSKPAKAQKPRGKLTHTFDYDTTHRVLRFEQLKALPQTLIAGEWVSGESDKATWPLFNEQALLESTSDRDSWVLFVEGEKTARALEPMGFIVTTAQGGANRAKNYWQPHYTAALTGRNVAILRDQDKPGHEYGETVAQHLLGHAARLKVIDLPGLEYRETHGDDPENWRDSGGRTVDLREIIWNTPDWKPAPLVTNLSLPWLTVSQAKALPPVQWLIYEILPERGLVMLYAPSGAGKSFKALDWSLELACADQQVLYFVNEGQADFATARINAWEKHNYKQVPDTLFLQMHRTINLLDDTEITQLLNDAATVKPALIVFDTMSYMLAAAGLDENSNTDMGKLVMACNRIQVETGATVLLLHHPTKDGRWERGAGALRGACDVIVELVNTDSYITMSCSKTKGSAPFADRHYQLLPVHDSCVLVAADKIIREGSAALSEKEKTVLDVLSWETFIDVGCKSSTLAQQARINEGTIFRVLRNLMKSGLVCQDKKGEPFRLTDAGRQYAKAHELS